MAPPQIIVKDMEENNKKGYMTIPRPMRQFDPLLVAFVGLPARGKSLLARRLARHLNFNDETAKVFDVTEYRRKLVFPYGSHEMFRADNQEALRVRQQSVRDAMADAAAWIQKGNSIAILDGPNVTRNIRQEIRTMFDPLARVMFVECVCERQDLLERNVKDILTHSADYRDMETARACTDLTFKLAHYRAQYEPPELDHLQLNDGDSITDEDLLAENFDAAVVTVVDGGHGGVIARGISGTREAAVLAYVSQPRPTVQQVLYFSRHGESEYNLLGRIGGDASLSPRGRAYATALARHINALALRDLQVWTSGLHRTRETAANVRAPKQAIPMLNELHAGDCEGLTYEELQEQFPKELWRRDIDKLGYRYPQGESYLDVRRRIRPVVSTLERCTNVLVVSHQAVLRCVLGYFLDTPPDEIPYVNVPLHTIIKLTLEGHSYRMETIRMPIECVDTHRAKPNCAIQRSTEDALRTVPAHLDTLPSPSASC